MTDIGKLICLEGPEGAGKSTQLARLKAHLASTERFVFVREPGGTPFGEAVRDYVIMKHEVGVGSQFLLFMASRLHIFETVVRPALAQGKHVITDRMDASTYTYQVYKSEVPQLEELFEKLKRIYLAPIGGSDWVMPHYIFLDLPPELGLVRRRSSSEPTNLFDEKPLAYHERVYEGYKMFIPNQRGSRSIDANQKEDVVFGKLLQIIDEIIKE